MFWSAGGRSHFVNDLEHRVDVGRLDELRHPALALLFLLLVADPLKVLKRAVVEAE
jgi:hypothetical protein